MTVTHEGLTLEELQLATRNHGMPLEALRYDLTPAGLHYLLIHYDIPDVDPTTWMLDLDGSVQRSLRLSLSDLAEMPSVTVAATMECAGNGRARLHPRPVSQPWLFEAVGTAEWTGVRVGDVLGRAGLDDAAREVVFTGMDRGLESGVEQWYQRSLPLAEARGAEVILAWAMNGQPLAPQHGAPLRLVVPGWYGMTNVKWLSRMTVVTEPFQGYQHTRSYRMRTEEDDEGEPVTRIQPRSLMIPPGIPDFLTRTRVVDAGPVMLRGRAWSGFGRVSAVEVSTDGGVTWGRAELGERIGEHGWHAWSFRWEAVPGAVELCSRATDETGRSQDLDVDWNLGGYQVNAVQHVSVEVRPA